MVSLDDIVYVIGGEERPWGEENKELSRVAKFENDIWIYLGQLNQSRHGHNSILYATDDGINILTVGGYGNELSTELWNIEQNSATLVQPELNFYAYFPALTNVNKEYCV